MRRFFISLVLLILSLSAIWAVIWWGFDLRKVYYGDLTASFASDLGDFVEAHDGQIPKDWTEFEQWQTSRDGKTRWHAQGSVARFELLSPPYDSVNECPRYVRVIDPELKEMEDFVNRRIESSLMETRRKKEGGQQTNAPYSENRGGSPQG